MSIDQTAPVTDASDVAAQLLVDATNALPSCGALAPVVRAFILVHQRALAFTSMVPVRIVEALQRNEEGISATVEAAAERVHGSAAQVEQARAIARQDAANGLRNKVVQGLAPKAAELGASCAAAGQDVDDALVRTALIFNDYRAKDVPKDLVTLIGEANLKDEIAALGCRELLTRVQARTAIGDDAEADRLLRVALPFIVATTRLPKAAIQKRLGPNATADAATREEDAAWKLSNIVDQRRAASVPPELAIVTSLRDTTLVPCFARTVGVNAWAGMSTEAFRAVLDGVAKVPARWDVDPNFYKRGLESSPRWGAPQAIPGGKNMVG